MVALMAARLHLRPVSIPPRPIPIPRSKDIILLRRHLPHPHRLVSRTVPDRTDAFPSPHSTQARPPASCQSPRILLLCRPRSCKPTHKCNKPKQVTREIWLYITCGDFSRRPTKYAPVRTRALDNHLSPVAKKTGLRLTSMLVEEAMESGLGLLPLGTMSRMLLGFAAASFGSLDRIPLAATKVPTASGKMRMAPLSSDKRPLFLVSFSLFPSPATGLTGNVPSFSLIFRFRRLSLLLSFYATRPHILCFPSPIPTVPHSPSSPSVHPRVLVPFVPPTPSPFPSPLPICVPIH